MKKIFVIGMIVLLSACGTIQSKFLRSNLETTRVIDSQASALLSIFGMGVDSCAVVKSPDSTLEITKLTYQNGECSATLEKKND